MSNKILERIKPFMLNHLPERRKYLDKVVEDCWLDELEYLQERIKKSMIKVDIVGKLPAELAWLILRRLNTKDLLACALVFKFYLGIYGVVSTHFE